MLHYNTFSTKKHSLESFVTFVTRATPFYGNL
jgi:hypothetical protein